MLGRVVYPQECLPDYCTDPSLTRIVVEGDVVPLWGPDSEYRSRDGWVGVSLGGVMDWLEG